MLAKRLEHLCTIRTVAVVVVIGVAVSPIQKPHSLFLPRDAGLPCFTALIWEMGRSGRAWMGKSEGLRDPKRPSDLPKTGGGFCP